jgi:hypothetical protein
MARYYGHSELRDMARAEERENPPPAILDCGHAPSEHSYFVHTYATTDDGRKICHACHATERDSRVLDCGHPPTVPHNPMTSGTAHTQDGREICCACADNEQRAALATATEYAGYVDRKRKQITTWTGGKLATLTDTWTIWNNFGGDLLCWNAVDDSGREWYGKGAGDGMITRMHLRKEYRKA